MKTCKEHSNNPVFIYAQCAGCEIARYRKNEKELKEQVASLKKDAERFWFIEQDASSGMSRIYGDEWVSVIDSIINKENNK